MITELFSLDSPVDLITLDLNSGPKPVRIGVVVKNQGLCSSGTFEISAYGQVDGSGLIGLGARVIDPTWTDIYGNTLVQLKPAERRTVYFEVTVSDYFLGYSAVRIPFYADDCGGTSGPSLTTCRVLESNETNNLSGFIAFRLLPPS